MKVLLIIFFLFSALHLSIALSLPSSIPEQNFPYKDILYKYFTFYPFTPFANFDGYQYISIARNGYNELQQSYFPLYPGILFLTAQILFNNYILSGVIVSWVFFFLGLWYFYKLAKLFLKQNTTALWAVLLIVSFPTAFYYQVIYTESLFLFLSAGALYYLYNKRLLWAALFAVFASLTKVQGALLIIPFLLMCYTWHGRSWKLLYAFAPLYGLVLYSGYLGISTGDPLYFYHAQSAFGAERSADRLILLPQVLYRYLKIFLTTPHNFAYWISLLEFSVCISFVGVIGFELYRLIRQKGKNVNAISLQFYSLAVLILPTLTGTLTSLPRYALLSFGFFYILARFKFLLIKMFLTIVFLSLHILLFLYFLKGFFVS